MRNSLFLMSLIMLASVSLNAQKKVEITGKYGINVACAKTYHVEVPFVAQAGKDKFSDVEHAIKLSAEMKKKLRPGMKIKVQGTKQPKVKKKMTKGEVRKIMAGHMLGEGLAVSTKNLDDIIEKIHIKNESGKTGKHNHGKLKIKPVEDDDELVEVTIPAHIAVEKITVVK